MVEIVWVRHRKRVRSFPTVTKNKQVRMMLQAIADFWKLGDATLSIGQEHALVKNKEGYSVMSLKSIRKLAAECGLGDGTSRASAIRITASSTGDKDSAEEELDDEELEAAVAAACRPRSERRARGIKRTKLAKEMKARGWRMQLAMMDLFYEPGRMYGHHSVLISSSFELDAVAFQQKMFEETRGFVATLHVVSDPSEALGANNCVGMASLWTLDGGCLTCEECLKGVADDKLVFVSFKHLDPQGGSIAYECKVTKLGSLVSLEPVDRTIKFTACLAIECQYDCPVKHYSFALDEGAELKLVSVGATAMWRSEGVQTLIPMARMNTVGAPLLERSGGLCGIVAGFTHLDGLESFPLHPLESKMYTADTLKAYVQARFKPRVSLAEYQEIDDGLQVRQLVHSTKWSDLPGTMTPVHRWLLEHSVADFRE